MKKGGGMCIIDRREEAHREKGDMYLEKGMDGEGSLQYVGSGVLILRGKTRGGGGAWMLKGIGGGGFLKWGGGGVLKRGGGSRGGGGGLDI